MSNRVYIEPRRSVRQGLVTVKVHDDFEKTFVDVDLAAYDKAAALAKSTKSATPVLRLLADESREVYGFLFDAATVPFATYFGTGRGQYQLETSDLIRACFPQAKAKRMIRRLAQRCTRQAH